MISVSPLDFSFRWFGLSGLIVLLDQLSKFWATASLRLYESLDWLPFLSMTLMHNEGAAFSMLSEQDGWQRWFLSLLAVGLSFLISIWIVRLPQQAHWQGAALALILGGAMGNLIDRLRFGYVVDFIDVHWHSWHWPAFNLADSAISVGAVILVLAGFLGPAEKKKTDGKGA